MLSIASLYISATPDRSRLMLCQVFDRVIFGVISVIAPPLSWILILILLPVLKARISNLNSFIPVRLSGVEKVWVRVLFREAVAAAIPFREYEPSVLIVGSE